MSSFPSKYFFIFANNPENEIHRSTMNAGLRLALTFLMDEFTVYLLLTEEAIHLAKKQSIKSSQQTIDQYNEAEDSKKTDEDINFSPYELLEGIISFGGNVLTCKSSLALTGLKADDLVDGVKLVHLQNAVKEIIECNQTFVF